MSPLSDRELALRPDTFRWNAEDIDQLNENLGLQAPRYGELAMPIEVMHGDADKTVFDDVHSVPLARDVQNGRLTILPDVGHMPHHSHVDQVIAAIDRGASEAELKELAPEMFADHWQQIVSFLEIITSAFPEILKARGEVNPGEKRKLEMQALCKTLAETELPITLAGSTGSLKLTRDLMAVIKGLPQGRVILPGYEGDVDASLHPTHPQHAMQMTVLLSEFVPLTITFV